MAEAIAEAVAKTIGEEPGLVRVQGVAPREGAPRPLHLPRISQLIVDAVANDVEIVDGSAGIRFTLVMRGSR